MGILNKLAKRGMFGLTGLAASKKGVLKDIARNGGFGVVGMLASDKAKRRGMGSQAEPTRVTEVEEVADVDRPTMRRGGKVKKMAKGGSVSSASKRADGCATKGKTKGRMV